MERAGLKPRCDSTDGMDRLCTGVSTTRAYLSPTSLWAYDQAYKQNHKAGKILGIIKSETPW